MPDLQEDDLMPNDGSFLGGVPREPVEQDIARKKEKAKTLEALPVIKEVIEHFTQRIEQRDKLSAINVDMDKDPLMFQKVFEVNRLLKLALEEEKGLLEDLLETHAKNK